MSVLKLSVEHYVGEINAICERLHATDGELGLHTAFDALKRLSERDDPDQDGNRCGDKTWDAVAAALAYYPRDDGREEEWLQGYGSFGPMWVMPNDNGGSTAYPAEPAKIPDEVHDVWRVASQVWCNSGWGAGSGGHVRRLV